MTANQYHCDKVYGIYLPPYGYILLSITAFMIFELIGIYLIELFSAMFNPKYGAKTSLTERISGAEPHEKLSAYQKAKNVYMNFQILYSYGTFLYYCITVPNESHNAIGTFFVYEDLMGRLMNSVVMSAASAFAVDASVIGTEYRNAQANFKKEVHTNEVMQFFINSSSSLYFHQKLKDYVATIPKEREDEADTLSNVLHSSVEDGKSVELRNSAPPTAHTAASNTGALGDNFVEESWLEMVCMVDRMLSWVYLPLCLRKLAMIFMQIGRFFAFHRLITKFYLKCCRFLYYAMKFQVDMGFFWKFVILLLPLLSAGATNILAGVGAFAWFYLLLTVFLFGLFQVVNFVTFSMVPGSKDGMKAKYYRLFLKWLWRIIIVLFFQTSFNYAYLLYSGLSYREVIWTDLTMRCNVFYETAFDDASSALTILNWL